MELREITVVAKRTECESFWKTRTSVRFIGQDDVHDERLIPDDDFTSVFDIVLAEVRTRVAEAVAG